MLQKIYLYLLILCGIFYHGIIAKSSDDNTRESSDLLVREKRVISHLPGGLTPRKITSANYMVMIKKYNRIQCAGAILTQRTVITAATCISQRTLSIYGIYAGSSDDRYSSVHTIASQLTHYGNLPHHDHDGISIITVNPPFVFSSKIGNIGLHVGSLSAGTQTTVSGWGCKYLPHPLAGLDKKLRSITLPIMNHEACQNIYRNRFIITDKHICTYDGNQHCALYDVGAPLVINNRMAGIHVWQSEDLNMRNPDVYINLQRADYSEWIRERSLLM